MPVILLRLPDLYEEHDHSSQQCPHCGSQILQRWGRVSREVQDTKNRETEIHRYRCEVCQRTFRAYPKGFDCARKTLRVRYPAALAWAMGMSYREVMDFFKRRGIDLSHTTVSRVRTEMFYP